MSKTDRPVPTFDHLKKLKPLELRDWLPVDAAAAEAVIAAEQELQRAQLIGIAEKVDAARTKLADAETELHKPENSVEVIFRNPGRAEWKRLKGLHPPTDEQLAEHEELAKTLPPGKKPDPLTYDPDSMAPALIAAAMVQPKVTEEQVLELYDDGQWGDADLEHLFTLALLVTTHRRRGGSYRFS